MGASVAVATVIRQGKAKASSGRRIRASPAASGWRNSYRSSVAALRPYRTRDLISPRPFILKGDHGIFLTSLNPASNTIGLGQTGLRRFHWGSRVGSLSGDRAKGLVKATVQEVKMGLEFSALHDHHLQVKDTDIHTGGIMGDKGGKKDKEKGQKQKAEKQVEKAKVKHEKDPKNKV
jgi:hypothetical protein